MVSNKKAMEFLKRRKGLFLNVVFFVVAFSMITLFQTRNMLATSGELAPALSGPLLRGGSYDIASTPERPVLVYFFAPWCTFCAVSSDNLTRLRRLRDNESLQILAVALDWQDIDEVRNYVERHDIELPVLLGDSRIAQDWHVYAFPTYYVLNSKKQIRRRDLGYSTQFGLWWRTWFVN